MGQWRNWIERTRWRGRDDSKPAKREDTKRRTIRRFISFSYPPQTKENQRPHLHLSFFIPDGGSGRNDRIRFAISVIHTAHTRPKPKPNNLQPIPSPHQGRRRPMSPYSYEPSSPKIGFFPTGPTSPNAFAGFHQSATPMSSMLGRVLMPSSSQNIQNTSNLGGTFTLRNAFGKRN